MTPRKIHFFLIAVSLALFAGEAPRPRSASLTIDQIMEGPDFAGTRPSAVRWSGDGHRIYFRWKSASEKKEGTYVVDAGGGEPRRLSEAEEREAPPPGGVENTARTRKIYIQDGDIYLLDLKNASRRRLTATV